MNLRIDRMKLGSHKFPNKEKELKIFQLSKQKFTRLKADFKPPFGAREFEKFE